jgi:hypothetical protein
MKYVFFTPWVGNIYFKKGYKDKKILVLGESHYCGNDCDSCRKLNGKCEMTINVIKDYLNYKNGNGKFAKWMNTFTKFTNIFLGKDCNIEMLNDFWNSVAFYNYVQKSIEGPRKSPTQQMFKDSETAFFEILNEYNPDIIFVWGKRLWNNLSYNGYSDDKYILDKHGGKIYFFKGKAKNIPAYCIYHPSTSYFYKCTKYVNEIMRLIQKNGT